MTAFSEARGFAGAAPGQDLRAVLDRLTTRDLQVIIGERVLPLLPAAALGDKAALADAAERVVRDRALVVFGDAALRKTLLRNLDPGKADELRFRVGRALARPASEVNLERLTDPQTWSAVEGFFGLAQAETATAARPLARQALSPRFGLFGHQRDVVRRALDRVGAGSGRTLIHMSTGSGKTRTAMHLAARVLNQAEPAVVVWLASSRELLEQAAEVFETTWPTLGARELQVQRFWGDYDATPETLQDGLLVAGFAKLHAWRRKDPAGFFRFSARTRLVIVDEAHQAIAPTYRAVIDGLAEAGQYNAVLGLSATPGRTWNDPEADERLAAFFEGSKVVLEIDGVDNPVKYLLDEGYLAAPSFERLDYEATAPPPPHLLEAIARADDVPDEALDALAGDTARNLAILEAVDALIGRGHSRIILFATSISHADDLATALTTRGIEASVVAGVTPLGRRAAILKRFKSAEPTPMVVCNFGVLTTGFDAPRTSAAIIARPTKSLVLYSQMVGRATRGPKAGGNPTSEIVTVHDPSYPGFGDIAEAFFNWEDVWHEPRA